MATDLEDDAADQKYKLIEEMKAATFVYRKCGARKEFSLS